MNDVKLTSASNDMAMSSDNSCVPEFINVKQEPLEEETIDKIKHEESDMSDEDETSNHDVDPLLSLKVENDDLDVASTSTYANSSTHWTTVVKEEILSDQEDEIMDTEDEYLEQEIISDVDSSSMNIDAVKHEITSEESSEESSSEDDEEEEESDNEEEDENDDDEEEEEDDDEEDDDDASDNSGRDPLRKCLNLLKRNPNIVLDVPEIAILLLILIRRRRRRRNLPKLRKRCWTLSENCERSARINFEKRFAQRRENHVQFLSDFNMSVKTFDELLEKISDKIKRKDTNMRYAITPTERLAVTLRYLASGLSYTALLSEFDIGKTTISIIVKTTIEIIWQELHRELMPIKTKEDWLKISERFYEKTSFPNCLGSICSKYVKVFVPKSKEAEFDRHHNYFATAILAIVDADMNFIDISVGVLGNSNDNFLVKSPIGQKITKHIYNIPEPKKLPGPDVTTVPHVFVSKDSINVNIMKPYSKSTDEKKNIFNNRLEKAYAISETCMKIIANKWKVLKRGIGHHTYAESTIKGICVLHNFIMKKEGINIDDLDNWILDWVPSCGMRGTVAANNVRDEFANYFVSLHGSVPWQHVSKYDPPTQGTAENTMEENEIDVEIKSEECDPLADSASEAHRDNVENMTVEETPIKALEVISVNSV